MKILDWIYKKEIKKAIGTGSPDTISSQSDTKEKINYYAVYFQKSDIDPYLIAEKWQGHTIACRKFHISSYEIPFSITFEESQNLDIEIRRYYRNSTKIYTDRYKFAVEHITGYFYIRHWYKTIKNKLELGLYNRRKIETENSMEVLKNIKVIYDQGHRKTTPFDYMLFIHRDLWLKTESRRRQSQLDKLKLILEHLMDQGKITGNGDVYGITGKGLSALVENESEVTKQKNTVRREIIIIFLTIALVFIGIAQAELVKFSTFWDFTK